MANSMKREEPLTPHHLAAKREGEGYTSRNSFSQLINARFTHRAR
jgi:hypothetical protein